MQRRSSAVIPILQREKVRLHNFQLHTLPWICLLKHSETTTDRKLSSAYKADSSTSWEQGRYATKVLSVEKEPVLKQVIPVYLNAFCSLRSPNIICNSGYRKGNQHFIIHSSTCMSWKCQLSSSYLSSSLCTSHLYKDILP